jgi:hypothetical protein
MSQFPAIWKADKGESPSWWPSRKQGWHRFSRVSAYSLVAWPLFMALWPMGALIPKDEHPIWLSLVALLVFFLVPIFWLTVYRWGRPRAFVPPKQR